MEHGNVQFGPPALRSLFEGLEPRNPGRGVGAFGGLPRLADALGISRSGPGAAGLGGLPGLVDIVNLSAAAQEAATSALEVLSVELTVSLTETTGVSVPLEDALQLEGGLDAETTAASIVDFATGLFPVFAEQNPELTEEEALAEFETLVRGAVDVGFAQAQDILDGLGQLDEGVSQLLTDIRAAVGAGLDAFFGTDAASDLAPATATSSAPEVGATDETALPDAGAFGITSFEQVSLNVSLQVAQARIETRAADALGAPAPSIQPVNFGDDRGFDDFSNELIAFANDLFDRLVDGEDLFGGGGLQDLLNQVLNIFGQGFDDALQIFDDFGAGLLNDGTPVEGAFAAVFQSVELSITQTRIETSDGLVIEQTSVSLRVVQIQIQGTVGAALAPEQGGADLPPPETPEDVAQNVLDFASSLFGAFRAQNPDLGDDLALADFIALTRDAAARGAAEALGVLEELGELNDDHDADIQQVLAALDALLNERFPSTQPLLT